jgi:chondroitin AC lyase
MLRLLLLLLLPCAAPAQSAYLDTVRARVIDHLRDPEVDSAEVVDYLTGLGTDGRWPDINYIDTSRTGFDHSRHLDRLVELARAYGKPGSPLGGDPALRDGLQRAIGHWLTENYISANWWHNQIGTPWDLVHTFLLLPEEEWVKSLRPAADSIIGRANLQAWGARPGGDLIKIAGILGQAALLRRDTATLGLAARTMAGEIQLATDRGTPDDVRGLQPDLSFQHRDDHVTSILSYGLGYAQAFAEWADWLRDTPYAFPGARTELLIDYYLDGIGHALAFGTYPDPAAKNRSLSRPGALHAYDTQLPEQLLRVSDYRAAELRQLIAIRKGAAREFPPHATFFWSSEHFTQQRPDYFTSVRMYSTRNHNMEVPYNGEGLTNHFLGDGANYLIRRGDEYLDIQPVWDWRKVPGATIVQQDTLPPSDRIQQPGRTGFVGGVTDGKVGAAVFDFASPFDSLKARKAWFFFADGYVCLGNGITSDEAVTVVTTLDQRWREGSVIVEQDNGYLATVSGTVEYANPRFVWHDSVAYLFPAGAALTVRADTQQGRWFDLNRQTGSSRDVLSGEVFSAWLKHGSRPVDESYAYFVLPGVDIKEASRAAARSPFTVLANNQDVQAVSGGGGARVQAIFHRPGVLGLPNGDTLRLASTGAVLLDVAGGRVRRVTVADPGRSLTDMVLTISDTSLRIALPGGVYAGQSVSVRLD